MMLKARIPLQMNIPATVTQRDSWQSQKGPIHGSTSCIKCLKTRCITLLSFTQTSRGKLHQVAGSLLTRTKRVSLTTLVTLLYTVTNQSLSPGAPSRPTTFHSRPVCTQQLIP